MASAHEIASSITSEVKRLIELEKEHTDAADQITEDLKSVRTILDFIVGDDYEPEERFSFSRESSMEDDDDEEEEEADLKDEVLGVIQSNGEAMSEADIAIELLKSGFKTTQSEGEFISSIYKEGIKPLIDDNLIQTIGSPPNRKYAAR